MPAKLSVQQEAMSSAPKSRFLQQWPVSRGDGGAAPHGAASTEASLDTSMRRLSRTAPIDVMQCHARSNVDMVMPPLHAWKAKGRIRRLGISHPQRPSRGPDKKQGGPE